MATIHKPVNYGSGKDFELKQLKSDLAALDRKITAELAPKEEVPISPHPKDEKQMEYKQYEYQENGIRQSKSNPNKSSLVAEPLYKYKRTLSIGI